MVTSRCVNKKRSVALFWSFKMANEQYMWSGHKVNVVGDERKRELLKGIDRYKQYEERICRISTAM